MEERERSYKGLRRKVARRMVREGHGPLDAWLHSPNGRDKYGKLRCRCGAAALLNLATGKVDGAIRKHR